MVYKENEKSVDPLLNVFIQVADEVGATYILVVGSLQLDSLVEEVLQDRQDTVAFQAVLQAREQLEVELHGAPLAQPDLLLDLGSCLGQQVIHNTTGRLGLGGRWLILPTILHARVEPIVPAVGSCLGGRRLVRQGVDDQNDSSGEGRLEGLLDGELQDQVDKVGAQPLVVVVLGQEVGDAVDLLLDAAEGAVGKVDDLLAQAGGNRGLVAAARAALVAVGLVVVVILCVCGRRRSVSETKVLSHHMHASERVLGAQ